MNEDTWAPCPWDPEVTMMWLMRRGELWVAPLGSPLPDSGDSMAKIAWMPATEAYRVHQSVLQGLHERAQQTVQNQEAIRAREGFTDAQDTTRRGPL